MFKALPPGSIFPKPYKVKVFIGKPVTMVEARRKLNTENAYYVYKEVTDELKTRIAGLKSKA
ncbi:MAG: hypothetical protein NT030_05725 [Candidatus Saganbacteria bacterium]|nr:hypothetical protein [Candidatus Saganbacteria bacterium]